MLKAAALTKRGASVTALVCAGFALLLAVCANVWAAYYVSSEHYIYSWDWAAYWLQFQEVGGLLRGDFAAALAEIRHSVAESDYTVMPILPLMPFELGFGPGRLSYILAITNAALLPSAALMAWVVERTMPRRSWQRFLLCTAGILGLHVLWAPALRGLPDVFGIVFACAALLVYRSDLPQRHRLPKLAGIGLLLCLLILTRRYYLFWVVSFFPGAMIAYLMGTPRADFARTNVFAVFQNLVRIAAFCGAFLLLLAAPFFARIAQNNYAAAYSAYRSELAGASAIGQVVDHFGVTLSALCAVGLGLLAVRRDTRPLGILLVTQALLALGLFAHVQSFLGVQHYYLLVPAAGIGVAALIGALWSSALRIGWRVIGIAGVFLVISLSSAAVFSPSPQVASLLLPQVRYAPLVRPDMGELRRLLMALAALKPDQVYIAASSQTLNWSILKMGCRGVRPDLCPHIAITQDIDTRDGFPLGILNADFVVLATPTQYHVRPTDQRVVGLVARDIRDGRGLGTSFRVLPGSFHLTQGTEVQIYRKIAPLSGEAVKAIGRELAHTYPQMRRQFECAGACTPS